MVRWVSWPVEVTLEEVFSVDAGECSIGTANDARETLKDVACIMFEATSEEFDVDDEGLDIEIGWETAGLADDLCQSSEVSSGDIEEPSESTDEGGGVSIGRDW